MRYDNKTKTEKTAAAKMKERFRRSDKWINFRLEKYAEQNGKDQLTGKPLRKGFQCHHKDLHKENYQILEKENFCCVNPQSHDFIHWFYGYYKDDPNIMIRLLEIMAKMKELSEAPVQYAQESLED